METTALAMFRQTVQYDGQLIWVRPVCDFFNLDVRNQHRKIKNDVILGNLVGKNTPDLAESENLVEKNGNLRTKKSTDFNKTWKLYGKNSTDSSKSENLYELNRQYQRYNPVDSPLETNE